MKAQWYGLYTILNCERKVLNLLGRKKIETYYPTINSEGSYNYKKKIRSTPLFTSYIFVKVTEDQHPILKKIPGVINLLFWMEKPVVITNSEIEAIKSIIDDSLNVQVQKTAIDFREVSAGPVVSHSMNNEIKYLHVTLPSIGFTLITKIETSTLFVNLPFEKKNSNFQDHQALINRTYSKLIKGH